MLEGYKAMAEYASERTGLKNITPERVRKWLSRAGVKVGRLGRTVHIESSKLDAILAELSA